jgi:uncharacterized protein YbaR (Trm112 family)
MPFDQSLLEGMLVCTRCRSPLVRRGDALLCSQAECRMQFAIRDEIPNMLLDDATAASLEDWTALMQPAGRGPDEAAKHGAA